MKGGERQKQECRLLQLALPPKSSLSSAPPARLPACPLHARHPIRLIASDATHRADPSKEVWRDHEPQAQITSSAIEPLSSSRLLSKSPRRRHRVGSDQAATLPPQGVRRHRREAHRAGSAARGGERASFV